MPRCGERPGLRQPNVLVRLSVWGLEDIEAVELRFPHDSRAPAYICASRAAAGSVVKRHFSLWQWCVRALAQGLPHATA